ncbi:MAG: hypothetical protein WBA58_10045 [Giesbergeria sp.]
MAYFNPAERPPDLPRAGFLLLALEAYPDCPGVALPKLTYIRPYIGRKKKNPAIFWIAGFPLFTWGG